MSSKFITTISCTNFIDFNTSSNILSIQKKPFFIKFCRFLNISSSSNPACFYVSETKSQISFCYFEFCKGSGGNGKCGNAFLCYKTSSRFSNSCAFACFYTNEIQIADSIFAFRSATFLDVNEVNSTKCIGEMGSSSITSSWHIVLSSKITFLNVCDGIDHNSLELEGSHDVLLSKSNIINSTHNSACVINIANTNLSIHSCCFMLMHSRFTPNTGFTLTDCISDSSNVQEGFTTYKTFFSHSFIVIPESQCKALYAKCTSAVHYCSRSFMFSVLVLLS